MQFASVAFLLFLPIVFLLYYIFFDKNKNQQNALLLLASCVFYASWDWRFLFLLFFSIGSNYILGLCIEKTSSKKKYLLIALLLNVGVLAYFKYFNFFLESFSSLLSVFGVEAGFHSLNIILPLGISFYTFHGLSYVIDIYNKKISPTRNFVDYSLFISYFPLLVAGPIERANHLLPQLKEKRSFAYLNVTEGLKQILWGFFKKVAVADVCARIVDPIFANYQEMSSFMLVLGAFFFAIQIYCDFSGYSDIAIGVSRMFGIKLLRNFNYPYFSRNIAEFWRRWHISLSSWFRDYLYIPLGGSREGMAKQIRNIIVVFLITGFWHGANWTFLVWGGLNAVYMLPSVVLRKNRRDVGTIAENRILPTVLEASQILLTFVLVTVAWVFFRSESVGMSLDYFRLMFIDASFDLTAVFNKMVEYRDVFFVIMVVFVLEWFARNKQFALENFGKSIPQVFRFVVYALLLIYIGGEFGDQASNFIYFQF